MKVPVLDSGYLRQLYCKTAMKLDPSTIPSIFGDKVAPDGCAVADNLSDGFGNSRVVDEHGAPLVVVHGTKSDFSMFETGHGNGESLGFLFAPKECVNTYIWNFLDANYEEGDAKFFIHSARETWSFRARRDSATNARRALVSEFDLTGSMANPHTGWMSSIRAYRFQLRCRPAGERALRRYSGMLRQVWNRALAEQRARHARGEKYASYVDMAKWLTAWRNAPETAWLAACPQGPQQQVLMRLDETYKRFFSKAGGFPRFKKYGDEPGLRFPDPKQFELDSVNGRIKLPKLGWVRMRQSHINEGELRNVTVSREGTKWFASIQTRSSETVEALGVPPTLGIDLGLACFAATSEGEMVAPIKALAKQQRRLKHAQRNVSRKKKGSANRKKAVNRLGAIHRKIAHQRADWLHKLTTDLADRHAVIAIEDLKGKNMSASARGTAAQPGSKVAQKAGLNRGILDASWGEFARQLTYKLEWRGGRVILVNPAYTSRTCRLCRFESAENRKTQSVFSCVACSHTENADVHAAKNILAAGHAAWEAGRTSARPSDACGGAVRRAAPERQVRARRAAPRPKGIPSLWDIKQEPTEATVLA